MIFRRHQIRVDSAVVSDYTSQAFTNEFGEITPGFWSLT